MKQYAAFARIKGTHDNHQLVTLGGQIFFANIGLIELCIEYSSKKHPDWEYIIKEVK